MAVTPSFLGGGSSSISVDHTGWGRYQDTLRTSASPLVIPEGSKVVLSNNAAVKIETHLPKGITTLYEGLTNKILPDGIGDDYILRVDFNTYTDNNNGYGELTLDVAGIAKPLISNPVNFPRGTGSNNVRVFSRTSLLYSLNTFVASGGVLNYESVRGQTSIYDIVYVISRGHKGK